MSLVGRKKTSQAELFSYKSFAQAWTVMLMELSIDYQVIDLPGLVKLAK